MSPLRSAAVVAVAAAALLTGCGGSSSSVSPPSRAARTEPVTPLVHDDRPACRAQLHQGSTIADRRRLTRLPLRGFQLRTNDLQEVVEEADHVCLPAVVRPLKAASLRLLKTDQYLLRCAPARTCDPARLRRWLGDVQRLEHRAETAFQR